MGLNHALASLERALDKLTRSIERLESALGRGTRGAISGGRGAGATTLVGGRPLSPAMFYSGVAGARFGGGGGGGLGGLVGGGPGFRVPGALQDPGGAILGGLGRFAKGAALGAGAAALGAGSALAGGGVINAFRGGTFAQGVSGAALRGLSAIPLVNEITYARDAQQSKTSTLNELNRLTNQVARFAGADAVTPEIRSWLTATLREQQENIATNERRNAVEVNRQNSEFAAGVGGAWLAEAVKSLERIANKFDQFTGIGGAIGGATGQ